MKHYSYEEWKLYAEAATEGNQTAEMEEHLCQCDECMACYLSIIEASDYMTSEGFIPEGFTDDVMQLVAADKKHQQKSDGLQSPKERKRGKQQIFKYYTIAASITVILFHYGIFDLVGESMPKAAEEIANSTQRVEIVVNNRWSDRLNSTFQFLDIIKKNKRSDLNEKK